MMHSVHVIRNDLVAQKPVLCINNSHQAIEGRADYERNLKDVTHESQNSSFQQQKAKLLPLSFYAISRATHFDILPRAIVLFGC